MSEPAFASGQWTSADGLTLHYRDYPGRKDRPPLLCIPGLTRNARDFEPVADAFAGEWRVIAVDLRGRGESDYAKDSATYAPPTYAEDVRALLDQLALDRVVAVGTSLGGIISVSLAARDPARFAGLAINDIGPVIEPAGLARIRDYVGQGRSFPTWMHAARALREMMGESFPDYSVSEWLRMAKRLMAINNSGRIGFDYDMRIAEPFAADENVEPPDMWSAFRAASSVPMLVLHGELSDILSSDTVDRMKRELPAMETITIARTGHAPSLDEPEAQAAIARLLARIA